MKTTTIIIRFIAFALLFQNCKSTKPEVSNNTKTEPVIENVIQQKTDTPEEVTFTEIETNDSVVKDHEEPVIANEEKSTVDIIPEVAVPVVKETPVTTKPEAVVPKKNETVKEPIKKPTPVVIPNGDSQKPAGKEWKVPAADAKKVSKVKADAGAIAAGKEIWAKECKSCHGTKGLGDGTKAAKIDISCGNFSSGAFQGQTDGELYFKTTKGRKPMPSFEEKLDDTQRWQLVAYMRTLK